MQSFLSILLIAPELINEADTKNKAPVTTTIDVHSAIKKAYTKLPLLNAKYMIIERITGVNTRIISTFHMEYPYFEK